jgi:hypothetical protein
VRCRAFHRFDHAQIVQSVLPRDELCFFATDDTGDMGDLARQEAVGREHMYGVVVGLAVRSLRCAGSPLPYHMATNLRMTLPQTVVLAMEDAASVPQP